MNVVETLKAYSDKQYPGTRFHSYSLALNKSNVLEQKQKQKKQLLFYQKR